MIKEETDIADLFFSEDTFESSIVAHVNTHLKLLFRGNEIFKQYCDLFAEINKLKPFGILNAHGSSKRNQGVYEDGKRYPAVQRWINSQDGNYGTLVLCVCNPTIHTPHSKESLLWAPAGDVQLASPTLADFQYDLIHPKHGIINGYTIEKDLEELKGKKS